VLTCPHSLHGFRRLSDATHRRSLCGAVRRLPLASSQGLFLSAAQVGQGTARASRAAFFLAALAFAATALLGPGAAWARAIVVL
jgi:hypothetical protein